MTDSTRPTPDDVMPQADSAATDQGYRQGKAQPRYEAKSGPKPEDKADAAPEAEDPAVALARESAEMRDRLLRTLAEMENLRKRTEREVADARAYGIAAFARDILDIADNMNRALDAVPPEARDADSSGLKALVDGVELTERALLKTLEKNGVRKFEPQGEKFNPNLHQAMYEVPDSSVAAGTVVQVIQPGYMIGERMLRPAMVAVAKGGAKSDTKSEAKNDTHPAPEAAGKGEA